MRELPSRKDRLSRRAFLVSASVFALSAPAIARNYRGEIPWTPNQALPPNEFRADVAFLTADERNFLTAAVDRLIPKDDFPSASELGVVDFIDFQLAGPYGRGSFYYMRGPFENGLPTQGYQSLPPATLYRQAIAEIEDGLKGKLNTNFAKLSGDDQDKILTDLSKGKGNLSGVDGKTFFDTLWENTKEGYFSDPLYGGNRDMQGWRMIGFPGARYDYRPYIDHGGKPISLAPVGLKDFSLGAAR